MNALFQINQKPQFRFFQTVFHVKKPEFDTSYPSSQLKRYNGEF